MLLLFICVYWSKPFISVYIDSYWRSSVWFRRRHHIHLKEEQHRDYSELVRQETVFSRFLSPLRFAKKSSTKHHDTQVSQMLARAGEPTCSAVLRNLTCKCVCAVCVWCLIPPVASFSSVLVQSMELLGCNPSRELWIWMELCPLLYVFVLVCFYIALEQVFYWWWAGQRLLVVQIVETANN